MGIDRARKIESSELTHSTLLRKLLKSVKRLKMKLKLKEWNLRPVLSMLKVKPVRQRSVQLHYDQDLHSLQQRLCSPHLHLKWMQMK